MLCERAGDLISAYLDDELPSHEALSLEKHLKVCPTCAAQLDELRQMRAMLASLEEMVPPPGFHAALHARLIAASPASAAKVVSIGAAGRNRWRANRWVAAAAAAAVLTMSAGSYLAQQVAHRGPDSIAMVDNGGTSTTAPTVETDNPAVTAKDPDSGKAPADSASGTVAPGHDGQASAADPQPKPNPNPPTASDGLTPPQATRDDGVGLASQRPTATSTGVPSGTPTSSDTLKGPLLVYHVDIELQAKADEATFARLVTINEDLGGKIEVVGDTQLSGGTKAKLIVLRVPDAQYAAAKAQVLAIAPTISVQEYGPVDVTDQANVLRQRLNGLIADEAQAQGSQLDSIRQQIADCQQQLAEYYDQAQLATLQIMIVE